MGKQAIFVILYQFAKNFFFLLIISWAYNDVHMVSPSDIKNIEDWMMFSWFFLVPILIEVITLAFPFAYGLTRRGVRTNKAYYLYFFFLFVVEFSIAKWIIGFSYSALKIFISVVLFVLIFRRRLPLLFHET